MKITRILPWVALTIALFALGISLGGAINSGTRYVVTLSESDTEIFFETLDEIASQSQ